MHMVIKFVAASIKFLRKYAQFKSMHGWVWEFQVFVELA